MVMSADAVWGFVAGVAAGFLLGALLVRRRPRVAGAGIETPTVPSAMEAEMPPSPGEIPTRPASSRSIDVAAARMAGFDLRHAEDLTIIEGIGRHAEELLRRHDIASFAQLARRSVAELHAILEDGGPHFQYTRPQAWPRQALLASENRWAELKALQADRLGREPRDGDSSG